MAGSSRAVIRSRRGPGPRHRRASRRHTQRCPLRRARPPRWTGGWRSPGVRAGHRRPVGGRRRKGNVWRAALMGGEGRCDVPRAAGQGGVREAGRTRMYVFRVRAAVSSVAGRPVFGSAPTNRKMSRIGFVCVLSFLRLRQWTPLTPSSLPSIATISDSVYRVTFVSDPIRSMRYFDMLFARSGPRIR